MITNQTMKSPVNITIKYNIDQKHLLPYFQAKTGSQPKKKVLSKSVEYFCDDMRAKTVSQPYNKALSKSTEYFHDDKRVKTMSQPNKKVLGTCTMTREQKLCHNPTSALTAVPPCSLS